MRVTIDEKHIQRLNELKEMCALTAFNVPGDKEITCKADAFSLIYHILDDAVNDAAAEA